ncbi:hypothetical protein [Novosphingobium sp. JCM 18896]|uniref:hypothetical protein n=1 Tax=Novosphingobium sp. JCM 18896 TaxID=2989731 RepID=UPI002221A7DD|nr:hypothetical protein [Novosphingobium sp. JCM 18896]MCW1427679.1 hypothetical protein [Novosphingobium sp. JCM 18896]
MTNRPVASLSPTLLARKGAARPAMRPQLQPLRAFQDSAARQLDDLGWNDMGDAEAGTVATPVIEPSSIETLAPVEEVQTAEIVALTPEIEIAPTPVPAPEVVQQLAKIAARVTGKGKAIKPAKTAAAKAEPVKVDLSARRSALSDGRRAAFTLRLDSERHLKLRLACVTSNRSAQQLVTEALDRLIADLPDVAELAAKVRKSR